MRRLKNHLTVIAPTRNGLQPPGFSLEIGDCMPLDDTYYCLEDVAHYESATFRPTYLKPEHPKGNLWRIR